jgi:hypothetical protein
MPREREKKNHLDIVSNKCLINKRKKIIHLNIVSNKYRTNKRKDKVLNIKMKFRKAC